MKTILLISPYWKEPHRWMVSSVKLAGLWQRLGYRVVAVCMAKESGVEEVSGTLTVHRLRDWFIPDPFNYGIALGFTGYVRRVIREEKPDFIIVNKVLYWTSLCAVALRFTGHRILLLTDVLGGMTWWPRTVLSKFAMVLSAWTTGWLTLLCANRIVMFHPQPRALLRFLGIAGKTQVIPTGIDLSAFGNPKSQIPPNQSLRSGTGQANPKQIPNPKSHISVTYVGRLESVKGVDVFLAAAIPLKKQFPMLKIQVVGWYPSTSSGQAQHPLVTRYQRDVVFTGLRDDIPAILEKTDIFVLPSFSEGLSNALMEAMAAGCACVASDVGGNRFLIQNGISGFLFPPGDREALRAHIRRLIEDEAKREALGRGARERIEKRLSWDVVSKEYARLFSNVSC